MFVKNKKKPLVINVDQWYPVHWFKSLTSGSETLSVREKKKKKKMARVTYVWILFLFCLFVWRTDLVVGKLSLSSYQFKKIMKTVKRLGCQPFFSPHHPPSFPPQTSFKNWPRANGMRVTRKMTKKTLATCLLLFHRNLILLEEKESSFREGGRHSSLEQPLEFRLECVCVGQLAIYLKKEKKKKVRAPRSWVLEVSSWEKSFIT